MRILKWFGFPSLACVLASAANAQWLDDFDSYVPGPLAAQSAWEEWTGSVGVDANVDATQSFTSPHSVLIVGTNDVVYDFTNLPGGRPSSGVWSASIKTYVPLGATGSGFYILMNDYPTNLHWSVTTEFNATSGFVVDGTDTRRIRYGQWISFVVSIDLDNDRYDSWYDNHPLVVNAKWTDIGGQTVAAALDLYGDNAGLSGMYFDNARVEQTGGGPLALTSKPNPIGAGFPIELYSQSPLLGSGDIGLLFSWTINGGFVVFPLFNVVFDAAGEWTVRSKVPPGLSGIEAGLKMFALPAGGKVLASNEEVIVFL